jgi:hypothetical protein
VFLQLVKEKQDLLKAMGRLLEKKLNIACVYMQIPNH